ncbi:MAG TPA: hypothetical protein VF614_14620 [Chthoniobacteraceae bacterium]|jgi:hypothetical protein
MGLLLGLLAVASLAHPRLFGFAVRQLITLEAWRHGVGFHVRSVQGSIFGDPLVLVQSVWSRQSRAGSVTRVEVMRAEVRFSWGDFFSKTQNRWIKQLTLEGVSGKVELPIEQSADRDRAAAAQEEARSSGDHWLRFPARVEARDVTFVFQTDGDYVRLDETSFTLSEVEPGTIRAGRVRISQPWLTRTFRKVEGTTSMQETRILLANLELEPGVEIRSLSAEADELAKGRLNLDLHVSAFGGNIRSEAQTLRRDQQLNFEASGTFAKIDVAKLAAFLGRSEAAGGSIKEGRFTFRGHPRHVEKATASLRLAATNFQWESRQWDSLTLGATLMNSHLQIPELQLRQGQNNLVLSGDLRLPEGERAWWQSEFTCNIAAKIENLTEMSALLLPEFKFAAGKATVNGSIRGQNERFNGQLIVAGSSLKWRNAPIENLNAAVNLNGNEVQVSSLEIFNNQDYVRGRGVVNILGPTQYWGELRASVDDLAQYSALLQKPIVPEPLAGGAVIEWSGEGSAKGHSGKFSARLNKVRSLGALATQLHPINAELDGHYAPGQMLFSKFKLADDNSSFTANVRIGNQALDLQGIRLIHRQQLWLEGDALLPLDVWQAWPNTSLATLLNDKTVGKVNLNAYNLELGAASRLTGFIFPITGVVRGNLAAEGPIDGLQTSGQLSLTEAHLPLSWKGHALTGLNAAATFRGHTMQLEKLSAKHPFGDVQVRGTLGFENLRNLVLDLAVTSEAANIPVFRAAPTTASGHPNSLILTAALNLQVKGPASAAAVTGTATINGAAFQHSLDFGGLWNATEPNRLPPVFTLAEDPWARWQFDLTCRTAEPAKVASGGTLTTDLRLAGPGSAVAVSGTAAFAELDMRVHSAPVKATGMLKIPAEQPYLAHLDAAARGTVFGEPYVLAATGAFSHPLRTITAEPPLTPELVQAELALPSAPTDLATAARFSLTIPQPLADSAPRFDWPMQDPFAGEAPTTTDEVAPALEPAQ